MPQADPIRDWTDWQIWRERARLCRFFEDHIRLLWKPNRHICILSAHMVHTNARVHTAFTQLHSDSSTTDFLKHTPLLNSHPNVSRPMKRRDQTLLYAAFGAAGVPMIPYSTPARCHAPAINSSAVRLDHADLLALLERK